MKRLMVLALLAGLLGVVPQAASAAPISDGCRLLNQAANDGYYTAKELAAAEFSAGEVVRVRAFEPSAGAAFVHLLVDQAVTVESPFPGKALWVVPADATYTIGWDAGGDATWRVSCSAPTVPFAPQGPLAQPGDGQAQLSWGEPAYAGGAPVDDYRVQYRLRGGHAWSVFVDGESTAREMIVNGLLNGKIYQFRVSAHNSYGWGPYSYQVMAKIGTPTGPQGPAALPADGQVQLSWGEPLFAGGAAITDYVVQYRQQGAAAWAPVRDGRSTLCHTNVLGLTNGMTYEFRIAARNAFGRGPWSEIVEGTPSA